MLDDDDKDKKKRRGATAGRNSGGGGRRAQRSGNKNKGGDFKSSSYVIVLILVFAVVALLLGGRIPLGTGQIQVDWSTFRTDYAAGKYKNVRFEGRNVYAVCQRRRSESRQTDEAIYGVCSIGTVGRRGTKVVHGHCGRQETSMLNIRKARASGCGWRCISAHGSSSCSFYGSFSSASCAAQAARAACFHLANCARR